MSDTPSYRPARPRPGDRSPAAAAAGRVPPPAARHQRISIDDFMKVELRVAKVLAAERVPEVEEAAEAVGRRRHRAANAGRRHRRGLRARSARRQDRRDRLQPEAGQADGHRVERHGARREPRRRQADGRLVRESARPGHTRSMIAKAAARGGGDRSRPPARSPRRRRRRALGRSGDRAAYFASIRNNPSLLLAFLARDAEGRRPPQPSVGCDLRRELSRLGGRGRVVRRGRDAVDRGGPCDAAAGRPPAADVVREQPICTTGRSTRCRCATGIRSLNGHDHFFATFGKFGPPVRQGRATCWRKSPRARRPSTSAISS